MNALKRLFTNQAFPREHRTNFINLCLEVAWWGLVSGTALNFLTVYATRLGGNAFQIGLFTSIPALVNLVLALPAIRVVESHPVEKTAFWCSVFYRLGFFLWIPLPFLFAHQTQIWLLIFILFLMGIPLTVQGISFNTLFATVTPPEWRATIASTRNLCYSVTYMLSVFGAGWLLSHLAFPFNYQVVFGIGSFAAMMGCIHLFFIRPHPVKAIQPNLQAAARPIEQTPLPAPSRASIKLRFNIWRSPFGWVLLALLGLNLTQNLPAALFPIYYVNVLHLTDQNIGMGLAFFYLTSMLGSTQVKRLVNKLCHRKVTGLGLMLMFLYPGILAFAHSALAYYVICIIGGFAWALVNSTVMNYVLENVPENEQPVHMAWYSIVVNFSVLAGSMLGPLISAFTGLAAALFISAVLRLGVGYLIFVGKDGSKIINKMIKKQGQVLAE